MPRLCRGQLTFEGVVTSPVWLRWLSCTYCGAAIAADEKGGFRFIFKQIPTDLRYGNDPEYRVESNRPDSVRDLPKVQSQRVGGPIGRYQL
jgi:hypothetical protein